MDYRNQKFMLAPLLPDAMGSDLVPFSQDPLQCRADKTKDFTIGMIIMGIVLAVVVAVLLYLLLANKARKTRAALHAKNNSDYGEATAPGDHVLQE